jgi:DUF4097 and DUF4098 domain-containing protein YvlB
MAQQKWLVDGPKTIDADDIRKVKVGLVAGDVSVLGHDEPYVRVEVHSITGGKDLLVQIDGDTLEIDHAQLRWDNFIEVFRSFRGSARADVTISVPRDITLKFGVVSATALVSGLTAEASVSTVSGDVVVDGLYGDLSLNAVSGELAVRNHYGKITAHTISGDITTSGEIMRLDADTVSGDVFADVTGTPDVIAVNTISGDVTVRLQPDVASQYRINTVSGRLQLDDSSISGVRGAYTGKYGTLDERWLEFRANTVSGAISVLHQVSA